MDSFQFRNKQQYLGDGHGFYFLPKNKSQIVHEALTRNIDIDFSVMGPRKVKPADSYISFPVPFLKSQ